MSRFPDFICIGVQKSATTWLYKMLTKHPAIVVPRKKEAHYFDRLILTQPLQSYREMFDDGGDSSKIAGEKTPCYAHLKHRSIAFVREVLPDVKIIVFLRRPEDRAWSQARMEVSEYNKRDLTDKDTTKCIFETGLLRNRRRTSYDSILKKWLAHFPREQVFIGLHEELEERPKEVLTQILDFLGVESDWFPSDELLHRRVWSSPGMKMPASVRWHLRRTYGRVVRESAKYYPGVQAAWRSDDDVVKPSLGERLKVLALANVATIPYNAAYLAYDALRDVRLAMRIRAVRREERRREEMASQTQSSRLATVVRDSN